ncbi:MAG TPA: LAGLIDADG family homing endonuclease [Candidatus Paceibacterota bacterium]
MDDKLSSDYIRGLIEGEGCFTFHTTNRGMGRSPGKTKLPAFVLAMSTQDNHLVELVKQSLGLKNKVHSYPPRSRSDGYTRQGMSILVVRDFPQLKNIIVPFFHKSLRGNKAIQFRRWIQQIGSDPSVPEAYKLLELWSRDGGFYDKGNKILK